VQIAKVYGAKVTGVCSTRNLGLVRSIGADEVIDYTHEDFTQASHDYDLIVDTVGTHSLSDYRRVLKPDGALVIVGSWTGPVARAMSDLIGAKLYSSFVGQKIVFILAELNPKDLDTLRDWMQAGKVTPVIDRRYALSEVPEGDPVPGTGARARQSHRYGGLIWN